MVTQIHGRSQVPCVKWHRTMHTVSPLNPQTPDCGLKTAQVFIKKKNSRASDRCSSDWGWSSVHCTWKRKPRWWPKLEPRASCGRVCLGSHALSPKGRRAWMRDGCRERLRNVPEPVPAPRDVAYTRTASHQPALYVRHSGGEQKDSGVKVSSSREACDGTQEENQVASTFTEDRTTLDSR